MSNQTRGRGLVLHFYGSPWILREGRSRQQMSLYPVVTFDRRKIAFSMYEFWKLNKRLSTSKDFFSHGFRGWD